MKKKEVRRRDVNQKMDQTTTNFEKHTSKNPLKKFLIDNYNKNLLSIISPLDVKNVLDAGCGEGFVLNLLYQYKIGRELEGVEFADEAINIGKKIHPYLNLKRGSIYALRSSDRYYDIVLCTEVLEHLEEPEKALKEIERVAKKYVLITVPHEPWWTLFNFTKWGMDIGHINHWSGKGIERFIKRNSNLKIIKKVYSFPWTMILAEK